MSQNPLDNFMSCEDDEFVLKVDKDIREYLENLTSRSVLLFPPVNSYRRFLIHKVCESVTATQPKPLSTFSIGVNEHRRTVVCQRYQLLVDLQRDNLKRTQESQFTWSYLKRNSKPRNSSMGVESHTEINGKDLNWKRGVVNGESSIEENCSENSKKNLASRTRRPDRAVYIPRAKRSQTTPPSTLTSSNQTQEKSHKKSATKLKSKSIDENNSSEDNNTLESINSEFYDSSVKCEDFVDCEENLDNTNKSDEEKNQKNITNFTTMSDQQQKNGITIESAGGIVEHKTEKIDKDEKELIKASQEINRRNRKLIKQTFNSNVLEIEASNHDADKIDDDKKAVNKDDDDWDTLFDDNGDCLDPKMIEELTTAVGKVKIEKPKSDYSAYHANMDLLKDDEFPHVLECSNFPIEFKTQDLMRIFSQYKESGFDLKWVDDTHCLVIFSNARIAAEVLTMCHPVVKLNPVSRATQESRAKAKKCSNSLLPYKQRPETCAALAKRLVAGHLGIRNLTSAEDREKEKRVLREAKERKAQAAQAAKAYEESWNS